MLCVYALTGPRALGPGARGITGERLRLVTAGVVAAVVGDVTRVPRPTVSSLQKYDGVIRRLHVERPALLPARFGTCFSSADELVLVLRERQRALRQALSRVRHRTQMTLRVIVQGHQTSGPGRESESPPAEHRSLGAHSRLPDAGSRYLRSRVAEAAREREIPGFDAVRAAVRRWVRDERVEKRAGVISVYHLVPRGSAAAYRGAAGRAAAESGLRIVVSGPWPPYAFATW